MTPTGRSSKTKMVARPHPFLKVWWTKMNEFDKREVQRHIGYLPSLMEVEAWPDLIDTMIKFWNCECMVFRFGNVEMTPTLEEVLASYESVGMCNKRKSMPDSDILIPRVWSLKEITNALSMVSVEWISRLEGKNIPFRKLYYRFGRANGYERFKEEFTSEQAWEEKRSFVFAVCLLGTMVFPQNRKGAIHPSTIMITHAIFNGIKRRGMIKYYTLAPMILADIFRALDKCQNKGRFFQGCNLILQWWMMKHLLQIHNPIEPDLNRRNDQFAFHSWWLHLNHFKAGNGQQFWTPILSGLREEDVQWSIDNITISDAVIRSENWPFLVLAGLRGTRPYAPDRVLRQLGYRQVRPQTSDMKRFATDHKDGKVCFARRIIQEWKSRSKTGDKVSNRFDAQCTSEYKDWLKETIVGTIRSPDAPDSVKDVELENQVLRHQHAKDTKVIKQLRQELSKVRECLMELDDRMEQQTRAMEKAGDKERVKLARDYLWENRYFIWHEVEAVKRAKINAETETA